MFAVEEDEEGGKVQKLKLYRNFKTDIACYPCQKLSEIILNE